MTTKTTSRMERFTLVALCLAFALGVAATAEAGDGDAAAILDRYIKVTGGADAYNAIKNRVSHATLNFETQGITAAVTVYLARPRNMYTVTDIQNLGKIEQGTDGEVVWEMNPMSGPKIQEGDLRALMLRGANLDTQVKWREAYNSAELAGTDEVDGEPCDKVVLTPAEGKPETRCYDKETGLLVRTEITVPTPAGEIPMTVFTSDYKEVDGILLPFHSRIDIMGQTRTLTLEKVEHNVEIEPDRFAIPEDIRKLMAKDEAAGAAGAER